VGLVYIARSVFAGHRIYFILYSGLRSTAEHVGTMNCCSDKKVLLLASMAIMEL